MLTRLAQLFGINGRHAVVTHDLYDIWNSLRRMEACKSLNECSDPAAGLNACSVPSKSEGSHHLIRLLLMLAFEEEAHISQEGGCSCDRPPINWLPGFSFC